MWRTMICERCKGKIAVSKIPWDAVYKCPFCDCNNHIGFNKFAMHSTILRIFSTTVYVLEFYFMLSLGPYLLPISIQTLKIIIIVLPCVFIFSVLVNVFIARIFYPKWGE